MTQILYFPVLLIYSIYLNSQHCTFNTKIGAFFGIMKEKKIVQIFKEREKCLRVHKGFLHIEPQHKNMQKNRKDRSLSVRDRDGRFTWSPGAEKLPTAPGR